MRTKFFFRTAATLTVLLLHSVFAQKTISEMDEISRKNHFWDSVGAQKIQWASSVLDFSSETTSEPYYYTAKHVIGKPNSIQPLNAKFTWSPDYKNRELEYIKVGFEPMQVEQVMVIERVNTGAIKHIHLFDENNQKYTVYTNDSPKKLENATSYFRTTFTRTAYKVSAVQVDLQCSAVDGFQYIDAIAISDSKSFFTLEQLTNERSIHFADNVKFEGEPENLGTKINSDGSEIAPVISPDGQTLYICRDDHEGNINPETQDIWTSTLDSLNVWGTAVHVGAPLNTESSNAVNAVTPDGNTLLVSGAYNMDGSVTAGISLSYRTQDGWSFPQKLEMKNLKNYNRYSNRFLATNGKVILLAVEDDNSYGDLDIYVSFLQTDSTWSQPKNLGPQINTVSCDATPFLAADMKTLYFSSRGHPGFGSADIFQSSRLDDSWENWSTPQNLGRPLNSEGWDAYLTIPASGDYAYLVSSESGFGQEDIFRIKLKGAVEAVYLVSGIVTNSQTNKPMQATIRYINIATQEEVGVARSDPNTGEYKVTLPKGVNYSIHPEAIGFYGESQNLEVPEDQQDFTRIRQDLVLQPVAPDSIVAGLDNQGTTSGKVTPGPIQLNSVFFGTDSCNLDAKSNHELGRVADIMKQYPNLRFEVAGHTDSVGTKTYNLNLSQKRAEAVRNYLITLGILPERLSARGYGEGKPIDDNGTEAGRQKNRRVELDRR